MIRRQRRRAELPTTRTLVYPSRECPLRGVASHVTNYRFWPPAAGLILLPVSFLRGLAADSDSAYATSSSARGFLAATSSNVRAAPDGARRPCSQSCNVRTDTPSNDANRDWESPVFPRIIATSGTLITRPYSPRLISRSPSRISRPTFLFVLAIFHFLPDLPEYVSRDVVGDVLRMHREHPDHAMCTADVVNHAVTAPLTAPRCCPAKLADTARARDYRSSLRIRHQRRLQCQVLIIRHVAEHELHKEARLDEAEHHGIIRQCRIRSSGEVPSTHWPNLCPLACSPIRRARLWPDRRPTTERPEPGVSHIDVSLRSPRLPHIPRKFTR